MSYTHLSQEERYQIGWLRKGGWSLEAIGSELHRAASTISREMRRSARRPAVQCYGFPSSQPVGAGILMHMPVP